MNLFGWHIEHERSADGRWDLTTYQQTPDPNPAMPGRNITTQIHYRVWIGFSTIATHGRTQCHQFVIGSHSWTFVRLP